MKRSIITILLILSSMVVASAQSPQYFWSNYSSGGFASGLAWDQASYTKYQCIYPPSHFSTAPSGNVSSIYVRVGFPPYPKSNYSAFPNFSVRMGWTSDSAFIPVGISPVHQDTFAFCSGLSTVFSSPNFVTLGVDTQGKWVKIPLVPNTFYYNANRSAAEGKYLVVEFRLGAVATNGFTVMSTVPTSGTNMLVDILASTTTQKSHNGPLDFGFDIGTPVSVDDALISNSLSISPNPSTDGKFSIGFDTKKSMKDVNITVRSMTGAVVYNQHYSSTSTRFNEGVNISNSAKGLYFVEVLADGERVVKKVVIQ